MLTATVSNTDCGKVLIVADEPSNKLIIITAKANMDFFDKVIKSLDVETTPEVSVEMIRVKYAEAEDVVKMLHDLLPQAFNEGSIKALADKRCNLVVVMASKADMDAIKRAIDEMDVKPSQMQLETVIIQVELDDDLQTGADWIERGRQKFFDGDRLNIAAIVQAAKSDSRTKILHTPTLTTLDNMCAEITATESIYLLGNRHSFSPINSRGLLRNHEERDINISMRDIGLTMKVRPRVNPT